MNDAIDAREPLLRLRHISKTYQMGELEVPVLRDVDLDVLRGELMVVVGPSGSGKSTLLNMIGGIDQPSSGDVFFKDRNLGQSSEADLTRYRRRSVGFVFQFYNLVPTLTARENVVVATEISDDPLDPEKALELVGLSDRSDHFPSQLSGGEQQRVAIARGIAKNPELLLCDEPTGALDLNTGRQVLQTLGKLNAELGTATLIITHNSAIAQMAHRIVRIGSGTLTETVVNSTPADPQEIAW